jgi:conjugative transfer signal peptidase TraF
MLRAIAQLPDLTEYLLLHSRWKRALYVTAFVIGVVTFGGSRFIGVNTSASAAPVGFYLRTAPRLVRGNLVEVCLPHEIARLGVERGYLGRGWQCADGSEPVGKTVLGLPGDIVHIRWELVLAVDTAGRSLKHFPFGFYRLKPGEIWLFGSNSHSWDSRYYGPIPVGAVRASLSPLVTW